MNGKQFDQRSFNAESFAGKAGWAVGPQGRIAKFNAQQGRHSAAFAALSKQAESVTK
jgi:hypothetical protein